MLSQPRLKINIFSSFHFFSRLLNFLFFPIIKAADDDDDVDGFDRNNNILFLIQTSRLDVGSQHRSKLI